MNEEKNPFNPPKEVERNIEGIKIPEACSEGTCEHGAKKERKVKDNIGM